MGAFRNHDGNQRICYVGGHAAGRPRVQSSVAEIQHTTSDDCSNYKAHNIKTSQREFDKELKKLRIY